MSRSAPSPVRAGNGRPSLHLWLRSVRARTVLAALAVVGVALGPANVLLIVELNASQVHGVDGALRLELN